MVGSMSRKAKCWDNATTESWFNNFKSERYHDITMLFTPTRRLKALNKLRSFITQMAATNALLPITNSVLGELAQ